MNTGTKTYSLWIILFTIMTMVAGCSHLRPIKQTPDVTTTSDHDTVEQDPYLITERVWPEARKALFIEASLAVESQDWERADTLFTELVDQDPGASGVWFNWAVAAWRQGQREVAAERMVTAIKRNPSHYKAYVELGVFYRHMGRFEESQTLYLQALTIRPQYAAAWYNLGVLYELFLNQPDKAIEAYTQYLSYESNEEVEQWVKLLKR